MFQMLLSLRFAVIFGGILIASAYAYNTDVFSGFQSLPTTFSLPVPYTTQAPDGAWEKNANCEEASAVMAQAYFSGDTREELPATDTLSSMADLVRWEETNLGHSIDTGATEIARMIEENFQLTTKELTQFTEHDLKKELFNNHVLILPVNLKLLGNAKYQGAGADYHVIVIRGYTEQGFLVNDPGTTNGKNNTYSYATLSSAAADWDSANHKLDPSRNVVLVVWK
jgi:hypothetical protein